MGFFPPVNPNAAYIDEDSGIRPGKTPSGNNPFQAISDIWSGKGIFNKSDEVRKKSITPPTARKFADLRGSVTPGSNEPAANNLGEGASFDRAERYRAGAGYPIGVTRPDDYPVAFVPDSTKPAGGGGGGNRNSERTNVNGIVQKGTDMSRSFNDLLATTNTSGYQPFSSNQLPTTGANPYAGTLAKTDAFNPAAPGVTGQSYDNYAASGGAAAALPGTLADKDQFNPSATRIEGGSDRKKGGSMADALNDKAGINSYMSKFSSGDRERAANRAFLDTEDSMDALRAKEAVNGVVYANQQHYVAGSDADGPAQKISRAEARDISNGRAKAQDFASRKVAETVAAVKQAPVVLEEGAKDGAFQQDKPMFSGSTPAIGGAVEFDNNNDKTLPTFGNNGGYKSGFKKIDTSMGNPFG